ncbi:MAG TPA: Ig-like domain-containing protein [Actinomycetota bacterium]|nr:Ig-like domain-containing protein [Actinomycetota bacterium]
MQISLRRTGGLYWNGTSFASSSEVLLTPTGTTTWSYAFDAFPVDGSYTLRVVATDTAGNTSSTSTAFTIDDTAPSVAVTFPANGATYGNAQFSAGCASPGVCGTAGDAISLGGVAISIRHVSTGNYFNGTSFAAATEQQLAVSGTTAWSYAIAATTFPMEGSYVVRATATDSAGTTTIATSTLTFDRTGPSGADVATTNAGTAGRPEKNDTVSFTFSEAIAPGSVLVGWSGAATDVSVRINDGGAGSDTLEIWNGENTARLPMGTIDLGPAAVVTNVVFRGDGANASTMVHSGDRVTVTLGSVSSGTVGTVGAAASVVWTPSATVTDLYGNACSTTAVTRIFPAF